MRAEELDCECSRLVSALRSEVQLPIQRRTKRTHVVSSMRGLKASIFLELRPFSPFALTVDGSHPPAEDVLICSGGQSPRTFQPLKTHGVQGAGVLAVGHLRAGW